MQFDWLTVTAQIVNFLVLVWLLQRFLYRPITRAMARREERIEARLAEARETREKAEAEARRVSDEKKDLEERREEILKQARHDAAELRNRLEDDIRAEMESRRETWSAHLDDEREAFAERLRQRAGHQVIDIVERVLRDYAGEDLARQLAGTFADRLADIEPEARRKLEAAAGRAKDPARVESSLPLSQGVRSQTTRVIHECVGVDIEVEYVENEELVLGIRLTIGEQTVEWSAAQFLNRLETTLDEVIEGSGRHRPDRAMAKS